MGKGLDKRTLRWRNLPDAWMDWRAGTLNLRETLFMLGVLKGKPAKVAPLPDNVDRETMLCTIRIRYDTARRLTDLAESLDEPGPLALAGRLLDESMMNVWFPIWNTTQEGERLLEAHGRVEYRSTQRTKEGGWSSSVTAG